MVFRKKEMTIKLVSNKKIREFLLEEEENMENHEKTYALQIINQLDYGSECSDTMEFFKKLREKRLKTHAKVAEWALNAFESVGVKYSLVLKRISRHN